MMGKGAYERFKFFRDFGIYSAWVLFSSCSTPPPVLTPTSSPTPAVQVTDLNFSFPVAGPVIDPEVSPGEVVPGTVVLVKLKVPPELRKGAITGQFEGIEFPFFLAGAEDPSLYEAVLGIPYETKAGPGSIKIHLGEGPSSRQIEKAIHIVEGHYPSEALHVDNRRVHPTRKKDLIRIKKELAEVALIYKAETPEKFWNGPFVFPIQSKITSPFGTRRTYNGEPKNFHPGLDLKAPEGTPIHSAAPGKIVMAKNLFFTGNTVMIDHGYGIITLYAHMSRLDVKVGQIVEGRQILGLSGSTGRVNGPHLHWQAVVHRVKINPLGLIQVIQ